MRDGLCRRSGQFGVLAVSMLTAWAATGVEETAQETGVSGGPSFVTESGLDLDAVVAYFEDLYRSDSSIAEAELTVTKPGRTRSLDMKMWTRGTEKALVVIQGPPREKGMATLKVGDNLWNYMPRIHRTIRIPSSMMQSSWMGSDFTNDDVVRESSFRDDYTHELVGKSEAPSGWLIRFHAKPDVVGLWNRLDLVVDEDGTIPIQAQFFDRRDELARSMYWSDVKVFSGRPIPSRLTLIPEDEEGNRTVMAYKSVVFNADVPDAMFSLSELEQSR